MPASFLVLAANAAEAAGRVTFYVLLLAAFVAVVIGYGRRRSRGQRATGWLIGAIVLGLLVLGALAGAAQR